MLNHNPFLTEYMYIMSYFYKSSLPPHMMFNRQTKFLLQKMFRKLRIWLDKAYFQFNS